MCHCRLSSSVLMLCLLGLPAAAQTPGAYLGELTWPEAERRVREAAAVIIPFAAGAKEHGPHLPMNADQIVMEHLVQHAVTTQAVVAVPPVLHGWFPAFRDYPGTEVADASIFQQYMLEIGMSLVKQGAKRLVFLNTGITRATGLPISIVAREIRVQAGVPTLVISWDDLETEEIEALQEQREGGHSDEIETSINLYLQPGLVHMDRAVKDYGDAVKKDHAGYQPGLFSRDPADPRFSKTGVYGDPTLATAEKGKRALEIMTAQWLRALREFGKTPLRKER